jgi:hypothetical protein
VELKGGKRTELPKFATPWLRQAMSLAILADYDASISETQRTEGDIGSAEPHLVPTLKNEIFPSAHAPMRVVGRSGPRPTGATCPPGSYPCPCSSVDGTLDLIGRSAADGQTSPPQAV